MQQPYPPPPSQHPSPQPYAPPPQPAADPRNKTEGIIVLVCAALVLVGLVSYSWFTGRDGGGSLGLLGLQECEDGMCHALMWFDIKRAPGDLVAFAMMGLIGGAAAVGFMIHSGVLLLQNRLQRLKLKPTRISLGLAAGGFAGFMMQLTIGPKSKGLSLGWAGIVAFAGLITASVLIQRASKRR